MKLNLNSSPTGGDFYVRDGGVKDLPIVTEADIGVPGGIAILDQQGIVDLTYIDSSLMEYRPTLDGPLKTMLFAPMVYKITNYSFHRNYNPTTSHGSIEINGDTVRFIPNRAGTVSFTLHGTTFSVLSEVEYVLKPTLVGPTGTYTSSSVTIQTSPFQVINGTGTHEYTDWEVALDDRFTTIFFSSLRSTTNKTSLTFASLQYGNQYFVRSRHKANEIIDPSAWSDTFVITTTAAAQVAITRPSITSPLNNASSVGLTPTFTSSPFSVNGWEDTFASAEWELASDQAFSNVLQRFTNMVNNNSWTPPTKLNINTVFYLRTRHKGAALGYSEWSAPTIFRTVNLVVGQPSITAPASGATGVSITPTLTSTAAALTGAITHTSSDWQISRNSGFTDLVTNVTASTTSLTSLAVTGLSPITTYYARMRHNTTENLVSAWSAVVSFTTLDMAVNKPSITAPANNAVDQGLSPTISSSAFSGVGGVTHASSSWEVSTSSSFGTVAKSAYNNTASLTSWSTSGLDQNTTYYVRVKHHGSGGFDSPWSDAITFKTMSKSVNTPSITSHTNGATVYSPIPFYASAFGSVGGLTHASSTWQLSTDANFSTILTSVTASTTNKTSWSPTTGASAGTTLYVRVKYLSTDATLGTIESAWSPAISVKIGASYIDTPYITAPTNYSTSFPIESGTISGSSYSGSGSFNKAQFQVSKASDFSGLILDETVTRTFTTFTAMNPGLGFYSTYYYARVRYSNTDGLTSAWSNAVYFRTVAAPAGTWGIINVEIYNTGNSMTFGAMVTRTGGDESWIYGNPKFDILITGPGGELIYQDSRQNGWYTSVGVHFGDGWGTWLANNSPIGLYTFKVTLTLGTLVETKYAYKTWEGRK